MAMNSLDVIIIGILGVSCIWGLFKGLVKEIFSIAALFISLGVSGWFYGEVVPVLEGVGVTGQAAKILSFVLLLIAVYIIVILVGKLIHHFVKAVHLGWMNRLAGMGFGLFRGIVISSLIILVLTVALSERSPVLTESKLTPHIMMGSKALLLLVPEDLKSRFMDQEKKLKDLWKRKTVPKNGSHQAKS